MPLSCIIFEIEILVKILIFSYPLHSSPPLIREVLVGILPYRLVYRKTRMVWLPDSEKCGRWLLVSTEYTNVTDRQTSRDDRPRLCIASRYKNGLPCVCRMRRPLSQIQQVSLVPTCTYTAQLLIAIKISIAWIISKLLCIVLTVH